MKFHKYKEKNANVKLFLGSVENLAEVSTNFHDSGQAKSRYPHLKNEVDNLVFFYSPPTRSFHKEK